MLSLEPPEPDIHTALRDPVAIDGVMQLATHERLLPALHEVVARHFAAEIPKMDRAVLAAEHEANRRRNRMIRDLLLEIGLAADHRGIDLVALKGGHWLLEDAAGLSAWRWMIDVDILVEPANFDAMSGLLAELGYVAAPGRHPFFDRRRARFQYSLQPHVRGGLAVAVEVHRHAGWRPDLLPTELMFAQRRVVAPGLAVAEPWCAAFHAVVHWQVQDGGLRRLTSTLRQILEAARFLERADVALDRLAKHADRVGARRELDVTVAFAAELFGVRVPAGLAPSEAARRHVARCLAIRDSPARVWIARERGHVLAMWDCKRARYRLILRQAGPAVTTATLWPRRLIRLPLMIMRALYAVVVGLAKLASESKTRPP
jgi:hypothetical protein